MTDKRSEIFKGYIDEIESYIPAIKEHLYGLYINADDQTALGEVLRLIHSIRGASALVGENTICRAAERMEAEFELCLEGELSFSSSIYRNGMNLVDIFSDFCKEARAGVSLPSASLSRRIDLFCDTITVGAGQESGRLQADASGVEVSSDFLEENLAEDEAFVDSIFNEFTSVDPLFPDESSEDSAVDILPVVDPDCEPVDVDDLENLWQEMAGLEHVAVDKDPANGATADGDVVQKVLEPMVTPSLSTSCLSDDEQKLLQEGFLEEADEHMQEIYSVLQRLESSENLNRGHHQEDIRVVLRAVHTIKGAAAVVGLKAVADFGHTFEDFLDWLYEGKRTLTRRILNVMATAVDLLSKIIEKPEEVSEEDKEKVCQTLRLMNEEGEEDGKLTATGDTVDRSIPFYDDEAVDLTADSGDEQTSSVSMTVFSDEEQQLLREGFFEEAGEHMQEIYAVLQRLDQIEDFSEEQYDEDLKLIRRLVHTIKGAAAVIGLHTVAEYGHKFEDFLDWLCDDNRQLSRRIFVVLASAVDLLSRIVDDSDERYEKEQQEVSRLFSALYAQKENEIENVECSAAYLLDRKNVEHGETGADVVSDGDLGLQEDDFVPGEEDMSGGDDLPTESAVESLFENVVFTMQDDGDDSASSLPFTEKMSAEPKGRILRISQARFDRLMKLVNDLLVGVSGFDSDMKLFASAVEDLGIASQRLKTIAQDLEKNYEVKALDQISHQLRRVDQLQLSVMQPTAFSEFDAMELDQYSNLHLIIRSLNESSVDFQTFYEGFGRIYDEIDGDVNRQYQSVRELQIQLMRARLMPLSALTPRLSRTVREVSSVLGKSVRLVMDGEWTELDRLLWEKLADPLMHILRNAIHHGIETEQQRAEIGKPSVATVRIAGSREGNQVFIRCSDDGRGLDFDAIKRRVQELDIAQDADNLTEAQLAEMVFHAGLSTKPVSEISGRGVGLDVVRQNVRELQGEVSVQTTAGEGTTFIIRIPLTLGVVRILQIEVGGVVYGIPVEDVKMVQRFSASQIDEKNGVVSFNNKDIPWFSLARLLGVVEEEQEYSSRLALLAEFQKQLVAVFIPEVIAQREVIIKELGGLLQGLPFVSGAAVLGDGVIVPVLNLSGLVGKAKALDGAVDMQVEKVRPAEGVNVFTVMVVDDSISIRRVIGRMIGTNGWQVLEAKDGQYALELLEKERPDCILLDIEMPRLNGFEFLTIMSNIDEYKKIPVVMLTSRSSAKHRAKAMELGAAAFLNKPSSEKELVETILQVLPEKTRDVLSNRRAIDDEPFETKSSYYH